MTERERGSAFEGFAALYDGTGNAVATVRETVATRCVLDYDLVQRVQNAGVKPLNGVALGRLAELYPFDLLKRPLLAHAREFVRQIATRNFVAVSNVEQFLVWGPYSDKVGEPREWVPERGNHTIPRWAQRPAERVWGYRSNELDWERGCAFLIRGEFTRNARHGIVDEQSGRIIV